MIVLEFKLGNYTPATIYQCRELAAPPVMNPSVARCHFALQTVVVVSVWVATHAFCSKSQTLTRPSIALVNCELSSTL